VTANQYAGAVLQIVNSATGLIESFLIQSHAAATAAAITFTLRQSVRGTVTAGSPAVLTPMSRLQ
jgi:hypothetical protein